MAYFWRFMRFERLIKSITYVLSTLGRISNPSPSAIPSFCRFEDWVKGLSVGHRIFPQIIAILPAPLASIPTPTAVPEVQNRNRAQNKNGLVALASKMDALFQVGGR
jgi:hypothetical protein